MEKGDIGAMEWRFELNLDEMCDMFDPQGDSFWDELSVFYYTMLGCTKCDILRFKD